MSLVNDGGNDSGTSSSWNVWKPARRVPETDNVNTLAVVP